MSKKEKLYQKLSKKPPPRDYRWDDLVTLFEQHDFTVSCSSGSHHTFQHTSGMTYKASKTHPDGLLKRYQIDDALEVLNRVRKQKP